MGLFMPVLVLPIILPPIKVVRLRTLMSAPDTGQSQPREETNGAPGRAGITTGLP